MKKVLTLLLAGICFSMVYGQVPHKKDPFVKTFVQDTRKLPNQQLQAQFRDGAAWTSFKEAHGDWWVEFNEQTGKPHRAFGSPIATTGSTPLEQVYNFLTNDLKAFFSGRR